MTSSTSSRTSSTAYLSRNFLVDITKSLKDNPKLASPDFKVDNFTTFINYFKNDDGDMFGVPMEAFVKVYLYRKDLFDDPKNTGGLQGQVRLRPGAGQGPTRSIATSPSSSPNGARTTTRSCGAPRSRRTPGHPSSWYEFFESWGPTFGVYNWGINPRRTRAPRSPTAAP